MDTIKDIVSKGVKNLTLAVTFGAYHAYIIDLEHKRQLEIIDMRNKLQLEEVKQIVRENQQKRSQWF